jgi:hypothetical protein
MDMLDQQVPASIIAEEFGITRNAAIGRIARDKELHAHQRYLKPKKKKKPVLLAIMDVLAARKPEPPPEKPSKPGKPASGPSISCPGE